MSTILITGCSSGFGLETARYFLDRDWSVVATMRTPREGLLPSSDRLRILPLDVTDVTSIVRAVESAGPVDVLVNNAGIGWLNPLESTPIETARDIFETNVIGLMAVTRSVLPQMRKRRSGVIVNVSSSVTLRPLLLLSVYTASKAAVNGFTESLALELEPFGIRTHLVLPGQAPETKFGEHALARMEKSAMVPGYNAMAQSVIPQSYAAMAQGVIAHLQNPAEVTHSRDVAEAVWRAATDPECPMRQAAGADAIAWSREAQAVA